MEGQILPINAPNAMQVSAYLPTAPAPRESQWTQLGSNLLQTIIGGFLNNKIKMMLEEKAAKNQAEREKSMWDYTLPGKKDLAGIAFSPQSEQYHKSLAEHGSTLRQQELDYMSKLRQMEVENDLILKHGAYRDQSGKLNYEPPETKFDPLLNRMVTTYPGPERRQVFHEPSPNIVTKDLGDSVVAYDSVSGRPIGHGKKPIESDPSKPIPPMDFGNGIQAVRTPDGEWKTFKVEQPFDADTGLKQISRTYLREEDVVKASRLYSERIAQGVPAPRALIETFDAMKQSGGGMIRQPIPSPTAPTGQSAPQSGNKSKTGGKIITHRITGQKMILGPPGPNGELGTLQDMEGNYYDPITGKPLQ